MPQVRKFQGCHVSTVFMSGGGKLFKQGNYFTNILSLELFPLKMVNGVRVERGCHIEAFR